ncbi:oligosaccharide flippase family protein [Sphingomonas sp.]|uniref:oligosaccharide flippase family protein n=1 Tax=Sphingomonas sp. TaxID=28214 RepID=UPI00389EEA1F
MLGLTAVGNLIVRTGSSMLMTRLLTPYDFGIVGIITAIFFAVTLVTDLGFEQFVVRHERTEDKHFLDVIWTIHVKRGVLSFIAVAAASPLIAAGFGKPVLTLPLAVASLYFLINGFGSLSLSTALRNDKARQLSLFDFALQIFQTASGLLLAWWWRSAWAIIAAILLHTAFRVVLSYRLFPRSAHRVANDRSISREFFAFSRVVLMSSLLTLMIGQSDKLVLGRLFTLSEFGLYGLALTIASAPTSFADSYLRRIAFPVYAQSWRGYPAALPGLYYAVRRLPSLLYAFACGGLIGSAPLLVALLYDPRYAAAAALISWLMLATALRLPTFAAAELLTAIGQVKGTLRLNFVRLLWLAASIPLGFFTFGAIGVVAAVGLVEAPTMLVSWILLRKFNMLNLREEFLYLGLVAAGAAIGYVGTTEILHLFPRL